ncbi:hypothetical protein H2198_003301 [Neophaeococcomyces mojaviensis]|uniref:Uncharacterized protein n=1 Tax=Neophaeococcomyces mojaviensis TaxID=3383035 RepID=A0ACC3ABX6_9EURO|nr:hypothetical protein H2198_003301 [Knufia sp. JES_112]
MNDQDIHSIDHTSTGSTTEEGKHSRRERLKDVLNRTKTKIHKVREEHEVKKIQRQQEKEKAGHQLDDDVNDFLAAGRNSITSQTRPSIDYSSLSYDNSTTSPRPSTSDSRTQQSPRRIVVPRIDVSSSQRFPNAKDMQDERGPTQQTLSGVSSSSGRSGDFLNPEYNVRSQSSSSIASQSRKARRRGLSVGFIDAPPVVIGEGGDEAMAPPVEISRAKARARSASPQGRRPYNATVQPEARRQMPARAISDNSADAFVPKPFARVQTGFFRDPGSPTAARGTPIKTVPEESDFVPRKPNRTHTNGSDLMAKDSDQSTRFSPTKPAVSSPARDNITREFEMTLGLSPNSTAPNKHESSGEPQIFAPKPQRRPPSYDLIEAGKLAESRPPLPPRSPQQQSQPSPRPQSNRSSIGPETLHGDYQHPQRKPVPQSHVSPVSQPLYQPQQAMQQKPVQQRGLFMAKQENGISPSLQQQARQQPQYSHPPTQQRSPVVSQQETGIISNAPLKALRPIVTNKDDQYRTFADRQRVSPNVNQFSGSPSIPSSGGIQSTPMPQKGLSPQQPPRLSLELHSPLSESIGLISPSEKRDVGKNIKSEDLFESPATATEPSQSTLRFYEGVNRGNPPHGYI